MDKKACVIGVTHINGKKYIFKNRDRNYIPEIKVYHVLSDNGTEILYFKDEISGWVEGINEHGIVVANAALMVLEDEKAGLKKGKKVRFSKDAHRMIYALDTNSLMEALHRVTHFKTGVKGHTTVSNAEHTYVIERTSKHEPKVELVNEPHFVRTNHGIHYPDAGYQVGADKESSHTRYETAMSVMESKNRSPYDIVKKLFNKRLKDVPNPNNVVRKTDNMFTSNQFIFEPAKRRMNMILIEEDCIFLGYEKHFSKPAKCSFSVRRVKPGKDGKAMLEKIEAKPVQVTLPPPNENVLRVFAYGSLMYEPELPDLICCQKVCHLNGMRRAFNVYSPSRKHSVLGTCPGGAMQGLIVEYPIENAEEVIKALDKREGFKEGDSNSLYLREVRRAYSTEHPQGVPCIVYITNEEHDSYVGHRDNLIQETVDSEDLQGYLRGCSRSMTSHGVEDKYLDRIILKLKEDHKVRI